MPARSVCQERASSPRLASLRDAGLILHASRGVAVAQPLATSFYRSATNEAPRLLMLIDASKWCGPRKFRPSACYRRRERIPAWNMCRPLLPELRVTKGAMGLWHTAIPFGRDKLFCALLFAFRTVVATPGGGNVAGVPGIPHGGKFLEFLGIFPGEVVLLADVFFQIV